MQRPLGVSRLELLRKAAACVGRYQEAFKRALAAEETRGGVNMSGGAGEGGEAAGNVGAAGAVLRFGVEEGAGGRAGEETEAAAAPTGAAAIVLYGKDEGAAGEGREAGAVVLVGEEEVAAGDRTGGECKEAVQAGTAAVVALGEGKGEAGGKGVSIAAAGMQCQEVLAEEAFTGMEGVVLEADDGGSYDAGHNDAVIGIQPTTPASTCAAPIVVATSASAAAVAVMSVASRTASPAGTAAAGAAARAGSDATAATAAAGAACDAIEATIADAGTSAAAATAADEGASAVLANDEVGGVKGVKLTAAARAAARAAAVAAAGAAVRAAGRARTKRGRCTRSIGIDVVTTATAAAAARARGDKMEVPAAAQQQLPDKGGMCKERQEGAGRTWAAKRGLFQKGAGAVERVSDAGSPSGMLRVQAAPAAEEVWEWLREVRLTRRAAAEILGPTAATETLTAAGAAAAAAMEGRGPQNKTENVVVTAHEQIASTTVPLQGAAVAAMGAAGNPAQMLKGGKEVENAGVQQRGDAGVGGSPAVGTAAAEAAAGIAGFAAVGTAAAGETFKMVVPIDMVGVLLDAAAGADGQSTAAATAAAAASRTMAAAWDGGGNRAAAGSTPASDIMDGAPPASVMVGGSGPNITVAPASDGGGNVAAAGGALASVVAAAMPPPSPQVQGVVSYELNDTDDVEVAAEQVMEMCSNMEVGRDWGAWGNGGR